MKNNVEMILRLFHDMTLECLVIAGLLGKRLPSPCAGGGPGDDEVRKAAWSRALGFIVDCGCVETICP